MKATRAYELSLSRRQGLTFEQILETTYLNISSVASFGGDSMEMDLTFISHLPEFEALDLEKRITKELSDQGYTVKVDKGVFYISWDLSQQEDDDLDLPTSG